ncbi:putative ATP-dependent RNA helicase DDX10-like protein [Dinothrombium tinctorium]|uniref:ATP-dependent RNA helicase n=1 Tax=Dinothrombium tinctorium TaxID=1965070 RepID=A0A443R0D4_9ACAR|nr:putative ATP-dependent RNA helicase DDX10-like protein [Dinothrombium tinctorium]
MEETKAMTKRSKKETFDGDAAKQMRKTRREEEEITRLQHAYENFDSSSVNSFADFPLSNYTRKGLLGAKYTIPTEIQREAIGLALKGCDILGAAKTGSGKTLAFVIPILECLFRERWTKFDGIGAIVITPTRELAYQIFEVINKVGEYHDFSVGLIIGGKDLKFEKGRMGKCNIVIATPGRLLQHMDENPLFICDTLKVVVLDEADRILDLGFAKTMNSIIENLPPKRQTLLFSATQTKSVKDLARLSLKDPMYVSVHENAKVSTPETLVQSYIVCELHDKLNILWSFIKSHRKHKILVFMSSCKQVKYVYELFCRMRPGISLLALYGTLHQLRRMAIYDDFRNKERAVLFATDIASRGLDFPAVHWVIQLDCPEDVNTYIHRAGRTARYMTGGESLLVLLPSEEESMIEQLKKRKIPINRIEVDPKKINKIERKAEALCARDVALKESAQRAFKAYVKNCFLMNDKSVFDVNKLELHKFAGSLGLEITPRIRFIEKARSLKHNDRKKETKPNNKKESLIDAMHYSSDEGDDLFTVKKVHTFEDDNRGTEEIKKEKKVTKAKVAKKLLKKNINPNQKIVFDDDGNPIEDIRKTQTSEKVKLLEEKKTSGIDIELAKEIMRDEDKIDKQLYRQMIKEKHRAGTQFTVYFFKERRIKEKEKRRNGHKSAKAYLDAEEESENEDEIDTQKYIAELPDPDAHYDSKDESNESEHEYAASNDSSDEKEDDSDNSEEEEFVRKKKRRKFSESSDNYVPDTGLSLLEDESLAVHLLNN